MKMATLPDLPTDHAQESVQMAQNSIVSTFKVIRFYRMPGIKGHRCSYHITADINCVLEPNLQILQKFDLCTVIELFIITLI